MSCFENSTETCTDFESVNCVTSCNLMQAQEVDPEVLRQKQEKEKKEQHCRTPGYALIAVALLVIILAVVFSQTNKEPSLPADQPAVLPSTSPSMTSEGVLPPSAL